ncbi:GNAT family N-acetyltransferase [Micromonospora sp. DT47]|uniref:GNAT family N-acetyltransferase n=1 Tax=Micromonospora sp. DT47 TaxID=3393431 RepID=UPI003CED2182
MGWSRPSAHPTEIRSGPARAARGRPRNRWRTSPPANPVALSRAVWWPVRDRPPAHDQEAGCSPEDSYDCARWSRRTRRRCCGDAELDISLGEKVCWGRGYGTEAMRLICRYGFDKMRLHRISLWVADENAAAIRVYTKVGFVEEGRARESFRRDGRWHDMIMMGLLEGELR